MVSLKISVSPSWTLGFFLFNFFLSIFLKDKVTERGTHTHTVGERNVSLLMGHSPSATLKVGVQSQDQTPPFCSPVWVTGTKNTCTVICCPPCMLTGNGLGAEARPSTWMWTQASQALSLLCCTTVPTSVLGTSIADLLIIGCIDQLYLIWNFIGNADSWALWTKSLWYTQKSVF